MAMLAALMPLAAACSPDSRPTIRTVFVTPDIPPSARVACKASQPPESALSQRQVLTFWSRDRAEIATCDARRAAAVKSVEGTR